MKISSSFAKGFSFGNYGVGPGEYVCFSKAAQLMIWLKVIWKDGYNQHWLRKVSTCLHLQMMRLRSRRGRWWQGHEVIGNRTKMRLTFLKQTNHTRFRTVGLGENHCQDSAPLFFLALQNSWCNCGWLTPWWERNILDTVLEETVGVTGSHWSLS